MVPDGGTFTRSTPGAAKLDGAVLLHYLDGFIDAGAAGLLSAHLMGSLDHEAVVTFDVDRLIDYRSRRPPMVYDKDHWDSYDAPELAIHQVRDSAGKTSLMLTGPEPDHEWERFTSAVASREQPPGSRACARVPRHPDGCPAHPPAGSDRARHPARAVHRVPADRGPAAGTGQRGLAAGAAPGRGEPRGGRLRRARAALPGARRPTQPRPWRCWNAWPGPPAWRCRTRRCGTRRGAPTRRSPARWRRPTRSASWCRRWSDSTTRSWMPPSGEGLLAEPGAEMPTAEAMRGRPLPRRLGSEPYCWVRRPRSWAVTRPGTRPCAACGAKSRWSGSLQPKSCNNGGIPLVGVKIRRRPRRKGLA